MPATPPRFEVTPAEIDKGRRRFLRRDPHPSGPRPGLCRPCHRLARA